MRKVLPSLLFIYYFFFESQLIFSQNINWSVNDIEIKDRLISNLRECHLNTEDSVYLANFNPNNFIEIVVKIENDRFKNIYEFRFSTKQDIRKIKDSRINSMPSDFIDTLVARRYAWSKTSDKKIEGQSFTGLVSDPVDDLNARWAEDLSWLGPSLFELAFPFRFSMHFADQRFGIFVKIGDTELGFPGPSISSLQAGIAFNKVKIYGTAPVVTFYSKRLETPLGIGLAFISKHFEGRFQFGELPEFFRTTNETFKSANTFYYMNSALQLFYVDEIKLRPSNIIRFKIGASSFLVSKAFSTDGVNLLIEDRNLYAGGYLRLEWLSYFKKDSYPTIELFLQSIIGNRSSFTLGVNWNIIRNIGFEGVMTYSLYPDDSQVWSYKFIPWGSIRFRL